MQPLLDHCVGYVAVPLKEKPPGVWLPRVATVPEAEASIAGAGDPKHFCGTHHLRSPEYPLSSLLGTGTASAGTAFLSGQEPGPGACVLGTLIRSPAGRTLSLWCSQHRMVPKYALSAVTWTESCSSVGVEAHFYKPTTPGD